MQNIQDTNKFLITNTPISAIKVIEHLNTQGFEAWIVGGFVRDAFLGIKSNDLDITTNAKPDEIKKIFSNSVWNIIDTGIKHGTLTLIHKESKTTIEITTYRQESNYKDLRHPDSVKFINDLTEDLSRRDFTINAVAWNHIQGFVDPFDGISDIKQKIIKTVGNPKNRFSEDALRILRAFRFASTLDFNVETNTKIAMFEKLNSLCNISNERIRNEITRALYGKNIIKSMFEYKDILFLLIPELRDCFNFDQQTKYHCYDIYEHTSHVVSYIPKNKYKNTRWNNLSSDISMALAWSALLHDIGKPQTFTFDKKGQGHFFSHQEKSSEMSIKILKRLKFSNKLIKVISTLIKNHDFNIKPTNTSINKIYLLLETNSDFDRELMVHLFCDLRRADILAHAEEYRSETTTVDKSENLFNQLHKENKLVTLNNLSITGTDLIDIGYTGENIKKCLDKCLNATIENKCKNAKLDLINYAKAIKSNFKA